MRYKLGRFMQFVGLFMILPLAIMLQFANEISVGQMFLGTALGMIVFYVGRTLQESAKQ